MQKIAKTTSDIVLCFHFFYKLQKTGNGYEVYVI